MTNKNCQKYNTIKMFSRSNSDFRQQKLSQNFINILSVYFSRNFANAAIRGFAALHVTICRTNEVRRLLLVIWQKVFSESIKTRTSYTQMSHCVTFCSKIGLLIGVVGRLCIQNGLDILRSQVPGARPCWTCLLYTSPSPRDRTRSRMPSSA